MPRRPRVLLSDCLLYTSHAPHPFPLLLQALHRYWHRRFQLLREEIDPQLFKQPAELLDLRIINSGLGELDGAPVSYTHLDVYKRQAVYIPPSLIV